MNISMTMMCIYLIELSKYQSKKCDKVQIRIKKPFYRTFNDGLSQPTQKFCIALTHTLHVGSNETNTNQGETQ